MGNSNSGRPGGNPGIVQYQFTTNDPKPYKISVMFGADVFQFLNNLSSRSDFIREAVDEKIARLKS
jgi:hypothetical protein